MTLREWICDRIKAAKLTAKNGRLYDTRLKAAEREKTLMKVLVELEVAGLDMKHRVALKDRKAS